MKITTLQEALAYMDQVKDNPELLVEDESLMEFANIIDKSGANLLSAKSDDYVYGMLSLIEATASTILISQGTNPAIIAMLLTTDSISQWTALIMKLTVGLSAMEELR